jgi:outer membrane protein
MDNDWLPWRPGPLGRAWNPDSRSFQGKGFDSMKALLVTVGLGGVLVAGTVSAQTAGQTAKPPATPPPAATAPAPAAQPPRPFPEGAKVAYVDVQTVASTSTEGKAARTKIDALQTKKLAELQEKQKALQAAQQKLQTGGSVMADSARDAAEKEIERLNRDLQRAQQDAQEEIQVLQRDLQMEFQRKLLPLIAQISSEKGLHLVFSYGDSGLLYVEPALDLTQDVIKRLDTGGGAAPKK